KSKAMRALPIRKRKTFEKRYAEFLGDPKSFWNAKGLGEGSIRVDTSIWNQGKSEYQGAIEVLANAIDATLSDAGADPIGRFGNGFRTILAVLKFFPDDAARVIVTTKTNRGLGRVMLFRYNRLSDKFQVTWRLAEANVPQGTTVDVQLPGSIGSQNEYLK